MYVLYVTCTGRSTNSPVLCLFLCPVPVRVEMFRRKFSVNLSAYVYGVCLICFIFCIGKINRECSVLFTFRNENPEINDAI